MNLVFHYFLKDVKSLRWILGLWLCLCLADPLSNFNTFHFISSPWVKVDFLITLAICGIGQLVAISILVLLIQKESFTQATSFWLTRPIPPAVYGLSKAFFILVLVALPVGLVVTADTLIWVPLPWLITPGVFRVGWDLMEILALYVVVEIVTTLWLATFTRSLVHFWGMSILLFVITLVLDIVSSFFSATKHSANETFWVWEFAGAGIPLSYSLSFAIFFAGLMGSLILHYGYRVPRRAFRLGVLAILLSVGMDHVGPGLLHEPFLKVIGPDRKALWNRFLNPDEAGRKKGP